MQETRFDGDFVDSSDDWQELLEFELQLVAGTAWLFAREEFDRATPQERGLAEARPRTEGDRGLAGATPQTEGERGLAGAIPLTEGETRLAAARPRTPFCDTLIVDEAGQVSLADVLAVGTAARNLVFLGDPNQLPQVSQGAHPEAAKTSVLQHLLGDETTVPPDRGIFLERTWRLRPELAALTSEAYYAGRLECAGPCESRSIAAGNGLFFREVEHTGNGQMSWEEARAVSAAIRELLGTPYADGVRPVGSDPSTRPLTEDDILVVTPYNAQVRALRVVVPEGVRVGTVDKFQGQEAPVVLVSLASSSSEEAPRGLAFVFNRNRINVATSRAQCRVELHCSPRLLEADCKTVEHMRLANALCRFVELSRD